MRFFLFSFISLACFEVTTAQAVSATKIFNFANSNDSRRIFFTSLTQSAVLDAFDAADYPNSIDLGIGMLSERPENCGCPDMRAIHSIATSQGQLKFERADTIRTSDTDYGIAGYVAPFPGYCNSDQIELIEFYSPIMNAFRYDTSNNIWSYYADYQYFYRPVRVIGYAYYSTSSVWMSGTPPFVKQGLTSPVYKTISARFDVVRTLTKGGSVSYAVNSSLIESLLADGYQLSDSVLAGPLSSQNDLETIESKCGPVSKCVETFDAATGVYRPQNAESQPITQQIVGECGYFLSASAATSCFSQATQYYSYIPSYNKNIAIYGNYNDNTGDSSNSVGYAYPYLFAFVKL